MAVARKSGRILADAIGSSLRSSGFRPVDSRRIFRYLEEAYSRSDNPEIKPRNQPIVEGERIFNLGLGQQRSNVFVFVRYNSVNDSVTVLMSSPRSDYQSSAMSRDEIYFRRYFRNVSESDGDTIAGLVAERAHKEALAKHPQEQRMQIHLHSRHDFNGSLFFDDGVSSIVDIVRRAMLHHADVLVYTPHNSFNYSRFVALSGVCSLLGITVIMGLELTAPLVKKHVNGPHLLVLIGDKDAAEEIGTKILSKRDSNLHMPSYWRSEDGLMLLPDILFVLESLQKQGRVAVGAAHGFNYINRALPVKVLGIFSAVDEGQIALQDALDISRKLDFYEAWNRSLSPEVMRFKSAELFNWISGLAYAHIYSDSNAQALRDRFQLRDILSANVCNLAAASWLGQSGLGSTYGPDDHTTPRLDEKYLVGGDALGAGFSFFRYAVCPSAQEIVRMLAGHTLRLDAHLYTALTDKGLQIADERAIRTGQLLMEVARLKQREALLYGKVLAADAFGFLANEPSMLGNMSR